MKGKNLIFLFACLTLVIFFVSMRADFNTYSGDEMILNGYTSSDKHYQADAFQDSTDYCAYYYDASFDAQFADAPFYRPVSEQNLQELAGLWKDFAGWLKIIYDGEEQQWYAFDPAQADFSDYVYIRSEYWNSSPTDYNIYFYDTQTHTLHYFHSNI